MHLPLRILALLLSIICIAISLRPVDALPATQRRDLDAIVGDLDVFKSYAADMTRHAENLHLLVQQPASSRSADFKQKSIDEASGFLSSLRGFHGTLAQLSTDEGLANYDLGESLGTPLRNIAHGIKSVLTDFETLADDIPDIGPQSYTILTDGFGQVIVDIDYSLRKAESLLDNTSSGFVESIAMFDELLYGIAQSGSSVSCTTAGCFLVPYVAT